MQRLIAPINTHPIGSFSQDYEVLWRHVSNCERVEVAAESLQITNQTLHTPILSSTYI